MVFTRVNTSLIQVLYTLGALSIYCAHPPDAILTLVPGPVRPLRPLMLAASPEVLDPIIPFLCTQTGYIHVLDMGGGRRAPYLEDRLTRSSTRAKRDAAACVMTFSVLHFQFRTDFKSVTQISPSTIEQSDM